LHFAQAHENYLIYGCTVETTKTTGLIHLFVILGGLGTTFIFYLCPFLSDVKKLAVLFQSSAPSL